MFYPFLQMPQALPRNSLQVAVVAEIQTGVEVKITRQKANQVAFEVRPEFQRPRLRPRLRLFPETRTKLSLK